MECHRFVVIHALTLSATTHKRRQKHQVSYPPKPPANSNATKTILLHQSVEGEQRNGYNILLTQRQIETARQNIRRKVKREGKNLEALTFLIDIAVSQKALAARMVKGKVTVNHWVAAIILQTKN